MNEFIADTRYLDGRYLAATDGTWHDEDAAFKARHALRAIDRNGLRDRLKSVCDIGCGSGGALKRLADALPECRRFVGFEVAPAALGLARVGVSDARLAFRSQAELSASEPFDLALVLDVMEHVPDMFGFLASIKSRAEFKLFHVPLDLFCLGLLRKRPLAVFHEQGHLHRFDQDTALATLRYAGHEIIDHALTPVALEAKARHRWTQVTNVCRRLLPQTTASRLVGGYSLMVLTR